MLVSTPIRPGNQETERWNTKDRAEEITETRARARAAISFSRFSSLQISKLLVPRLVPTNRNSQLSSSPPVDPLPQEADDTL